MILPLYLSLIQILVLDLILGSDYNSGSALDSGLDYDYDSGCCSDSEFSFDSDSGFNSDSDLFTCLELNCV